MITFRLVIERDDIINILLKAQLACSQFGLRNYPTHTHARLPTKSYTCSLSQACETSVQEDYHMAKSNHLTRAQT
jgi:hypothetical protein